MKRFLSFSIFLICAIFSCGARGAIHLTDSNYVVIPYIKSEFAPFKNVTEATLHTGEIKQIESLTNKAIREYNKQTKWGKIDKNYKVQLVPVINEKGEKEVWINCFCSSHGDWRKGIIMVDDGGSCFFNLKINLSKSIAYELTVNGYA